MSGYTIAHRAVSASVICGSTFSFHSFKTSLINVSERGLKAARYVLSTIPNKRSLGSLQSRIALVNSPEGSGRPILRPPANNKLSQFNPAIVTCCSTNFGNGCSAYDLHFRSSSQFDVKQISTLIFFAVICENISSVGSNERRSKP